MRITVNHFLAVFLGALAFFATPSRGADAPKTPPFFIQVIDDQTNRGVPMVQLRTTSNVRYYTDSAGIAAIDDAALAGQTVFFHVSSDGYEFPADGFKFRGQRVEVSPGKSATLKIKRLNIAERLYRTTGEGIYRDSLLVGKPAPIRQPLLNGQVSGQDSAQPIVYRGKIRWFWGDTQRPAYPLGQFWMSGATSKLPADGGLDPSVGVDFEYFTDKEGFSRPMVPRTEGPGWLDGLMILRDPEGVERLVGNNSVMKSLGECVGRQLLVYDDEADQFKVLRELPVESPFHPEGHPFLHREGETEFYYFQHSFPDLRVPADWKSVQDPSRYEGFTCLTAGGAFDGLKTRLDRDANGQLQWGWKLATPPATEEQWKVLVREKRVTAEEGWFGPLDGETSKPINLRSNSVHYNAFRKRFIMIAAQLGGSSSNLGEIWYAEADKPEGPWKSARKIVTHIRYSFYNPIHHPFFDQEGGRIIYFEGTYCADFSNDGEHRTPRYDYNQIMYRLDLADPRLR